MDHVKRFFRLDRDYFSNNQPDIQWQNRRVLRFGCAVYLGILAVYTALTIIMDEPDSLKVMYYVYDALHIGLCAAVFLHQKGKAEDPAHIARCRVFFELTLLSFFLLESVFPFPAQHSIHFPFPIILLVMLFTYSIKQALALIVSYVAMFVVLVFVFKTGDARLNDLYIAAGTLISALAGYSIVASLRHETGESMLRLRGLSMTDALTGLYNKQTFESLCNTFLEESGGKRGYALLFIDLDKFKQVNDRFGHQMGDAVLEGVGAVMRDAFYEKDYLCRFGGDEFVVFMVDVVSEIDVSARVEMFKQKVRELARTLKIDDIACSVGVAMKGAEPETYTELLSRADAALYVLKRSGGSQIGFAERDLRHAPAETGIPFDGVSVPENTAYRNALRKVLVVDDNLINRRILCNILKSAYAVLEAEDGKQALEILRYAGESISAVLLDLVMPVMDGYELLEEMRRDDALCHIPVIVTTGTTDEAAETRALALGANDYIVKPYRPAIIMHRLQNTIKLRESAAIANAAERDALTGVYSRDFFYQRAETILNAGTGRYDILCVNIEQFKLINELFGRKTGDALLRYIAGLLVESLKGYGICGRIGPDRFACLIPHRDSYSNADFEKAIRLVNRFPAMINITLRHGVYVVEDVSIPVSVMCERALSACASIKGQYGVYFAYYDDSFREQTLYEQFVLDGFQRGIAQKQFAVYYQPQYDLATGQMTGAEALVRWEHPEKGLILPAGFIPILEKNGLITELDTYVWESVCTAMGDWLRRGLDTVPISVNLSRMDIYSEELPTVLRTLTEQYALDPRYLHLEITESAYTLDPAQLIRVVANLRAMGLRVAMDNFGSGYSSLTMLSELPIDVLKLDLSLIREMQDERKRRVLRSIIELAGQLGLPVVAEGVETAPQAELLKGMGCACAQGFYFAKPMPEPAFAGLLQRDASQSASAR